jgi:hypothetical protein
MMPVRDTERIHGPAQLPRVSVTTTALLWGARFRRSASRTPNSAASCARLTVGDVSIDRYSSGIEANAAFSRSSSIRASSPALGSRATAVPYASAALT